MKKSNKKQVIKNIILSIILISISLYIISTLNKGNSTEEKQYSEYTTIEALVLSIDYATVATGNASISTIASGEFEEPEISTGRTAKIKANNGKIYSITYDINSGTDLEVGKTYEFKTKIVDMLPKNLDKYI